MAKKSATDLLYIPRGFLYRSNLKPTKRCILCLTPFIGQEIIRSNLETGVARILQAHGYAHPMNIAKLIIGQYETNYRFIFNISEPQESASFKDKNVVYTYATQE